MCLIVSMVEEGKGSGKFIFEDNTEHIASQVLGQPSVLQDCNLETLTLEASVEVGVDGSAHSLQHQ